MPESYLLLQDKCLEYNGILVLPKTSFNPDIGRFFSQVGELTGISKSNFHEQGYFSYDVMPIQVLGSLSKSSPASINLASSTLEKICNDLSANFDKELICKNQSLKNTLMEYELVKGDFYVLSFTGKYKDEDFNRSVALYVDPAEGKLTIDQSNVLWNGSKIKLDGDIEFALNCGYFTGRMELINLALQK